MESAIAAGVHVLAAALAVLFYVNRARALRKPVTDERLAEAMSADSLSGLLSLVLYGVGLWRLFGNLEKPLDWYTSHPLFWTKMGLIGLLFLLEMPVQYVLFPLQMQKARKKPVRLSEAKARLARSFNWVGVVVICLLIPTASLMARGIGHPLALASNAKPACAVQRILETRCMTCHSTTVHLGGLDIQAGAHAALVGKASAQWPSETRVVPGAPEQSLLYRKITGTQGEARGARMPMADKLDERSVEIIEKWIREGAPSCSP
ncbi:MAG: DUF2214 family protein [Deltaproteobacteria bacterium]|nr:DUF2214 family protein [Deltaproteobacteria bacterium]